MLRKLLPLLSVLSLVACLDPAHSPPVSEVVTSLAIAGVVAPFQGAIPVTTLEADQFSATVTWNPADSPFAASTVYTATVVLTPKDGWTFVGVAKDAFTVDGAVVTNAADSGTLTAVFPATGAATFGVTYDGNGSTTGLVPVDSQSYASGSSATILGNSGSLQKGDEAFVGWATSAQATSGDYLAGQTLTLTGDVQLYAIWRTYALGELGPAGGYIFYDRGSYTGSDWRYLEMAPYATEKTCSWGSNAVFLSGLDTIIGSGKANTATINVWLAANDPENLDRAAYYADQLVFGGYGDWYLPSKTEVQEIYYILKRSNVGLLGVGPYWTSTQPDARNAFVLGMTSDVFTLGGKNDAAKIRATRRF